MIMILKDVVKDMGLSNFGFKDSFFLKFVNIFSQKDFKIFLENFNQILKGFKDISDFKNVFLQF